MATADKLALLKATKANLKASLTEQGQSPGDVFETYPDLVRAIKTGVTLPTLTSPGAAADLRQGKQLIDQSGAVVNGAIPDKAGQSYVPTTTSQKIAAGQYLAGDQIIAGDANLLPENIVSGKSIFGVAGTGSSGGKYEHIANVDGVGKSAITIPCSFTPKAVILIAQSLDRNHKTDYATIITFLGHFPDFDFAALQTYDSASAVYTIAGTRELTQSSFVNRVAVTYSAASVTLTCTTDVGFASVFEAIVLG